MLASCAWLVARLDHAGELKRISEPVTRVNELTESALVADLLPKWNAENFDR